MTPNDKLPEEITETINQQGEAFANKYLNGTVNTLEFSIIEEGYIAGATAWAPWKGRYDELKKVLQEFVSNHEAGLLPNRFVYEKAIKILNDGK